MSPLSQDPFARLKALTPRRRYMPTAEPRGFAPDIPEGAERLAELVGASLRTNKFGEHLGLQRWFTELDGCEPPAERMDSAALRLLVPSAPEEACDPAQWLFLDTETTGIVGGTGTYPFLIGIAWWDAGGLEVEQFFMREFSEEHSVLVALAERLSERRVLVTFNGKSFDWPLLETRYRMTRMIRTPAPRAHFDFLHPARNLWRSRVGSARLADLERYVLGWDRGTDVISELIPSIYFDYLCGGQPEPLVPVFWHNQMDLRGLAALAGRVLSLLAEPEIHSTDALEIFGLSRICERRGETRRARKLYERSLTSESPLPGETDSIARRALARLAKRDGDFAFAERLWQGMLGGSVCGFEAYEQLAIHYEHRAREPHRAAELARRALVELGRASRLGMIKSGAHRRFRERFERRLARLERHAGTTLPRSLDTESNRRPTESNRETESTREETSMPEPDGAATKTARESEPANLHAPGVSETMSAVSEPYLRTQLEKRREELKSACKETASEAPFIELLHEVDAAIDRIDEGTYGICVECHEPVEQERLLADPLVRLCLDHLSNDEKRALERDLELASSIQRSLLPGRDVHLVGWNIQYEYKPAGLVSGDYCDLISPAGGDGQPIFLLGDVAGKGVAAALLMSHMHAMFHSLASAGQPLDRLLESANRVFGESTTAGQYATLICGRLGRSGEVELASAGHFPALHVSKQRVQEVGSTGLPLGMFSTSRYAVRRVQLDPDESLLLFTDGILEARDSNGREYGIPQLSRFAAERHDWATRELLSACMNDVATHATGVRQADDQTLMVIRRGEPAHMAALD